MPVAAVGAGVGVAGALVEGGAVEHEQLQVADAAVENAGRMAADEAAEADGAAGEVEAVEDLPSTERLRNLSQVDLDGRSQNRILVRKKSEIRMAIEARTTARVVARPTPSAPPRV